MEKLERILEDHLAVVNGHSYKNDDLKQKE